MSDDDKNRDMLDVNSDSGTEQEPKGSYFLDRFLNGEEEGQDSSDATEPAKSAKSADAEPSVDASDLVPPSAAIREAIITVLKEIYDPEIPVNIYEMGLIYEVDVAEDGKTKVVMTLTTPHCPVAETMPGEVEMRVANVAGVTSVDLDLVWDPPWDMSKMSDEARLELGLL